MTLEPLDVVVHLSRLAAHRGFSNVPVSRRRAGGSRPDPDAAPADPVRIPSWPCRRNHRAAIDAYAHASCRHKFTHWFLVNLLIDETSISRMVASVPTTLGIHLRRPYDPILPRSRSARADMCTELIKKLEALLASIRSTPHNSVLSRYDLGTTALIY